jgi:UDP-N-acetylmuramoyl-tripeptide--D-alanyl-D-alanine ligase
VANKFPVVKVVLCSHLKGVKPGDLPPELLRPIEGKGKLHHCAADAYEAMDAAANAEGIDLAPTSQADTYRSLETQEYGFYSRYTDKPGKKLLKQTPRIYKGKAWYLKKGLAPMAVPGTSNHNLGIAVDIANASGKRLEWLMKHAQRFGFSWEVQSEPWHLRYVAGDTTPEAVKEWVANQPATEA